MKIDKKIIKEALIEATSLSDNELKDILIKLDFHFRITKISLIF